MKLKVLFNINHLKFYSFQDACLLRTYARNHWNGVLMVRMLLIEKAKFSIGTLISFLQITPSDNAFP